MIALVALLAMALWCLIAFVLARAISALFPASWWRWPGGVLVFGVVFVMPVLDEMIGRRQFEALCKASPGIQVDRTTARGRTVYDARGELAEVGGMWIPVVARPVRFVDVHSGETVLHFRSYTAYGGLLATTVGFPEGGTPLSFTGSCSPAAGGKLAQLFKELQLTWVRPPKQGPGTR